MYLLQVYGFYKNPLGLAKWVSFHFSKLLLFLGDRRLVDLFIRILFTNVVQFSFSRRVIGYLENENNNFKK